MLHWTPAYPEKRNSGGLVDFDVDSKYKFVLVQAEDVMNSQVLSHNWRLNMKDGVTQILAGLQQQIEKKRLVTYMQERESYTNHRTTIDMDTQQLRCMKWRINPH